MQLLTLALAFLVSESALLMQPVAQAAQGQPLNEVPGCQERFVGPEATLRTCALSDKSDAPKLNVLVLRGDFESTARVHGRLLGPEIASGILHYVTETRQRFFEKLPPGQVRLYQTLLSCLTGRLIRSADPEFLAMHKNLAQGLIEAGVPGVTPQDIIEMGFANELGSIVSGLQRKIKRDPVAGFAQLGAMCGSELVGAAARELFETPDLGAPFLRLGCTGISVSQEAGNPLWMSRNLDGSALGSFDKFPTLILHDPRGVHPEFHRYVGVAAAGLHYVGGNAGFNEVGIGVTLHEMETENFRTHHPKKNALSAVYLQNRILERASSISEAWDIVRSSGVVSAWTIVVGDAKTGEIATFEISGDRAVIAQKVSSGVLAQANRFVAPSMQNQFYNYSYNKVLESRFRLARIQTLAQKRPDPVSAQWFLNALSEHIDDYQGLRSFGRNLIKTNTMMSLVFAPGASELLTSLGDRYPVGQGNFAHFAVNFAALDRNDDPVRFVGLLRSEHTEFENAGPWSQSLGSYVEAYLKAKANPDDPNTLEEALALVQQARIQALADGIREFPYDFILAKLHLKLAGITGQAEDETTSQARDHAAEATRLLGELVMASAPQEPEKPWTLRLHPYDRALTLVWFARALSLSASLGEPGEPNAPVMPIAEALREARAHVEGLLRGEPQDFELRQFLKSFQGNGRGSGRESSTMSYSLREAAALKVDFVTVE